MENLLEPAGFPPVCLLGTEFQTAEMDIPGKYKTGRCVSWEAKVPEKNTLAKHSRKSILAFSWGLQGALAEHWFTYFEKNTLEYRFVL